MLRSTINSAVAENKQLKDKRKLQSTFGLALSRPGYLARCETEAARSDSNDNPSLLT